MSARHDRGNLIKDSIWLLHTDGNIDVMRFIFIFEMQQTISFMPNKFQHWNDENGADGKFNSGYFCTMATHGAL